MCANITPKGTIFKDVLTNVVKYSPDGRYIACSGYDVRLWDSVSEEVLELTGTHTYREIVFSPEGTTLAVWENEQEPAGPSALHFYSIPNLREVATLSSQQWSSRTYSVPRILDMAFSPKGEYFVLAHSDGKLTRWSWPSFSNLGTISLYSEQEIEDEYSWVTNILGDIRIRYLSIRFAPGSEVLAVAGAPHITLWDLSSRRKMGRIQKPQSPNNISFQSFAFSPDGRYLAAGFDYEPVMLWDMWQPMWNLGPHQPKWRANPVHGGYMTALAFTPDGRVVLLGGRGGILVVMDASNGQTLAKVEPRPGSIFGVTAVLCIDIAATGAIVSSDGESNVKLWSLSVQP